MRRALWVVLAIGCSHAPPTPNPEPTSAPPATATATATAPPPPAAAKEKPRSLFDRLGGMPAITAVVDAFVGNVAADKRINQRFFNTDIPRLKELLAQFVCMATGGGCQYEGRDMKSAHAGMDLVDEEFDALVGNLKAALDKFHVGPREQGELLGALGPLKPQIVVPASALKPVDAAKLEPARKLAATLPPDAGDLLTAAAAAAARGQRSYAEQLFSRAELIVGAPKLASLAPVFREGAPPRVTTALTVMPKDTKPQPKTAGSSDEDEPEKKPARGSLKGVVRVDGKPLSLGLVLLEPTSGKFKHRTPKHRIIEQRGKQFAPRMMAVPVGSTVAFPNFDGIYHNVFSLSQQKPFDLGIYKNGETREVTFDKEGIIQIGCNLHPNMAAYLVIVAAPHYTVVDANGGFFFRSVAPGKYKMSAWSEHSAQPTVVTIDIKAGENSKSIDLKADAPPAKNADKFGAPR